MNNNYERGINYPVFDEEDNNNLNYNTVPNNPYLDSGNYNYNEQKYSCPPNKNPYLNENFIFTNFRQSSNGESKKEQERESPENLSRLYQDNYSKEESKKSKLADICSFINEFSDEIFDKNDFNKSSYLDRNQIFPAVCDICELLNLPLFLKEDVFKMAIIFDDQGNGLIDRNEFKNLLFSLCWG